MKNRFLIPVLLLLAGLGACTASSENKASDSDRERISIVHPLDTVEVYKNPKNVVALDYSSLETLKELGIPVVGTVKSNLPGYLSEVSHDESIEDLGTLFEVNYEKLASLEPEVIFISGRMQTIYPELSKIAPTIYLVSDTDAIMESMKGNLSTYGQIFEKQSETDAALADLQEKINALNQKATESGKTALVILHNNGKFSAYGKGSRFGIIHDLYGFKEAIPNLNNEARHGQSVSNEFIQKANPDYLFIIDRSAAVNKEATNKEEIENVLIQETNAFKNGKVIYLDPEAWYISGDGLISMEIMVDEVSSNF